MRNDERATDEVTSGPCPAPAVLPRVARTPAAEPTPARLPRDPDDDDAGEGMSRRRVEEWLAAMSRLRPYEQKALRVRYLSGLSDAEAAETMGLSHDAMVLTTDRAIDALQRALAEERPTGEA